MPIPEPPTSTVPTEVFFNIVNSVLTELGRDPLPPKGSQEQIISVLPDDQVLQILAGPGSGKTEMIVWRILYELLVLGTDANAVMATTFTRRAATELEVRIAERAEAFQEEYLKETGTGAPDPKVHNLHIGTVHSLCEEILVEHDQAYREAATQLIDDAETKIRLARSIFELGFAGSGRQPRALDRIFANDPLLSLFRAPWEDAGSSFRGMKRYAMLADILAQHVETWIPRCQATGVQNGVEIVHGPNHLTDDLVKLQGRWEGVLDNEAVLDFPTIQKRFLERQHLVEDQFRHIFVDEFQDNNPIQFAIHTAWLKSNNTRLTVVGDDDQALYRFRGSDITCFTGLKPECKTLGVGYRREALETNYRSTKAIVNFCQAFKTNTVLATEAMAKTVLPAAKAPKGKPVRLLEGDWDDLCRVTAMELKALGVGKNGAKETAAILMFSTSERETRDHIQPALPLRRAIEEEGIRAYNPTNKTAGIFSSPVAMLLGLISYLVDPVTKKKIPTSTRPVLVCASDRDPDKVQAALSVPVRGFVNDHHIKCQKHFFKDDGGDIGAPTASRKPLIDLLDKVRNDLAKPGSKPRLTLSGLVARLLTFDLFRHSGFTVSMFRQALFTQLLEASTAPTRLTMTPLDSPLEVKMASGKYEWSKQFWDFLHYFGGYLESTTLDDEEVEAFEEDAVMIITLHQAKGLEFDHVYVAGIGRSPAIGPALRTRLFSGENVPYKVVNDQPETKDQKTLDMATADREREVYVALSRAKKTLTVLQDAKPSSPFTQPNKGIQKVFQGITPSAHAKVASVKVSAYP